MARRGKFIRDSNGNLRLEEGNTKSSSNNLDKKTLVKRARNCSECHRTLKRKKRK